MWGRIFGYKCSQCGLRTRQITHYPPHSEGSKWTRLVCSPCATQLEAAEAAFEAQEAAKAKALQEKEEKATREEARRAADQARLKENQRIEDNWRRHLTRQREENLRIQVEEIQQFSISNNWDSFSALSVGARRELLQTESDSARLGKIALEDEDINLRRLALEKIEDISYIEKYLGKEKSIRRAATNKISRERFFDQNTRFSREISAWPTGSVVYMEIDNHSGIRLDDRLINVFLKQTFGWRISADSPELSMSQVKDLPYGSMGYSYPSKSDLAKITNNFPEILEETNRCYIKEEGVQISAGGGKAFVVWNSENLVFGSKKDNYASPNIYEINYRDGSTFHVTADCLVFCAGSYKCMYPTDIKMNDIARKNSKGLSGDESASYMDRGLFAIVVNPKWLLYSGESVLAQLI